MPSLRKILVVSPSPQRWGWFSCCWLFFACHPLLMDRCEPPFSRHSIVETAAMPAVRVLADAGLSHQHHHPATAC
jgi:hypothetical protein